MKVILLALILCLSGCMTTYEITKHTPDGDITVAVRSFREFQQPNVAYSRTGEDVTFTFGAESATTAESPIERAIGSVIEQGGSIGATLVPTPDS